MTEITSFANAFESYTQKAIIFDLAGTLLEVPKELSLPTTNKLKETDGLVEALESLLGRYRMAVTANQSGLNVETTWKMLRQAGLGEYFSAVFLNYEKGPSKTQQRLFHQIESLFALPARNLIMVGRYFSTNVAEAKSAGWKAVWYNPTHQIAPSCVPLQDADITALTDLPQVVPGLDLPDTSTCQAWLQTYGATFNLLAHVNLVASSAYLLAVWLRENGLPVNPILTHRGGLLHDIAKIKSLSRKKMGPESQIDHAQMGRDILLDLGQQEIAQIAHRHMLYQDPYDPRRPLTWEQKLVYFSDKLAEGSQLVAPQERIAALTQRYPAAAREIEAGLLGLLALLQELCDYLHLNPDQLIAQLRRFLSQK